MGVQIYKKSWLKLFNPEIRKILGNHKSYVPV
jgi:hypothetical protein